MTEQLSLVQRSHDELATKKQTETELLSRDLNLTKVKERDARAKILALEKDISASGDDLRALRSELDVRTRENDHIVCLLEDQEQKLSLYEEKEKQIQALAIESKKRIEDANLDRDRVLLKEQQHLARVARLED